MSEQDDQARLDFQKEWQELAERVGSAEKEPQSAEQLDRLLELRQRQLELVKKATAHEKEMDPVRRREAAAAAAGLAAAQLAAERARREEAEEELHKMQLKLMAPADRLQQFTDKHGEYIADGRELLYADGAVACPASAVFTEPPTVHGELARCKRRWLRKIIEREAAKLAGDVQWESTAAQMALRYGNLPSVPQSQVAFLVERKEQIEKMRERERLLNLAIGDQPRPIDPATDTPSFDEVVKTEDFKRRQVLADLQHLL